MPAKNEVDAFEHLQQSSQPIHQQESVVEGLKEYSKPSVFQPNKLNEPLSDQKKLIRPTMTKDTPFMVQPGKVMCQRCSDEQSTPGGLVLPELTHNKFFVVKIVAVGPGVMRDNGRRDELTMEPGDYGIIWDERMYCEITVTDGTEFYICPQADIVLTFKPIVDLK